MKKENIPLSVEVSATEEERDWVKQLATGKSTGAIAKDLKMAEGTFAYKLNLLRERFQCPNSASLIAFFIRNKLID